MIKNCRPPKTCKEFHVGSLIDKSEPRRRKTGSYLEIAVLGSSSIASFAKLCSYYPLQSSSELLASWMAQTCVHRRFRFSLRIVFVFVTIVCIVAAVVAWRRRETPLIFRTLPELTKIENYEGWTIFKMPDHPGPYAFAPHTLPYESNSGMAESSQSVRFRYKGQIRTHQIVEIPDTAQLVVPLVTKDRKLTFVIFKRIVAE